MKFRIPLGATLFAVALIAFWLQLWLQTSRHNAQLMDMTARHNAQLVDMTVQHNLQLAEFTARCNARLAAQAAEHQEAIRRSSKPNVPGREPSRPSQ